MTKDSANSFERETFRQWWNATCRYLFADGEMEPQH